MEKYLVGICVLVVIGVCCVILFDNDKEEDAVVTIEGEVHTSLPTRGSTSTTTVEAQPKEEVIEPDVEVEVVLDNKVEEPVEGIGEIIEPEPEEVQEVLLEDYDRPYNHTISEEDFMKMSPKDQRKVVDDVVAEAKEMKMSVMGCYQETQSLIKEGNYSAAEEKVAEMLDWSIAYDGGEESLVLSQIISLNSQNDLLGIMTQIYNAANRLDEKADLDDRAKKIQDRTQKLRDQQSKSYGMYWNK